MAANLLINYGSQWRLIAGRLQLLTRQHANRVLIANTSNRHSSTSSSSRNGDNNHSQKAAANETGALNGNGLVAAGDQQQQPQQRPQSSAADVKSTPDTQIKKSVFISQSHDIFTNLALEDWLYRNSNFTNHHALLLWSNDPCVVVGRHQNPYGEANMAQLQEAGIAVARRSTGGGTVYHDRGNLNMTFYTPRERYNRNYNLNILTRALFREWGIKAEVSSNDYVLVNDKKISEAAAKLGQTNAYHHCTLHVNVDKDHTAAALANDEVSIASRSVSSNILPIKNLVDVNRHVNFQQLLTAIGYEFLRTTATELHDGGRHLMMKQRGFQLVNPTEKWFPGLMQLREKYASSDWCLGKTPTFTVQKEFVMKSDDKDHSVQLLITVCAGLIDDITLVLPNIESIPVVSTFKGEPYSEDYADRILAALKSVSSDNVEHAMNNSL